MANKKLTDGQATLSIVGMIGAGIVLLAVGTAMKSHFQLNAAVCNTYGGSTASCAGNEGLFTLGQILQPIGGVLIGIGIILGVLMVVGKNSSHSSQETKPGLRQRSVELSATREATPAQASPEPEDANRASEPRQEWLMGSLYHERDPESPDN
jgi:hypothetical protein